MSAAEELRFSKMEHFGYGPNVMRKKKVCPACGRMVGAKIRTCPDCREQLSDETLFDQYKRQHMCCPDCDTVLAADSRYCPNCGKRIIKTEMEV